MALFSDNITIKYQRNIEERLFIQALDPGNGKTGLFRGELALLANDEGLTLFGLDQQGNVAKVRPELGELPSVDIVNPQPGQVLIFNAPLPGGNTDPDLIDRPTNKWINVPAPQANLSANSIFELSDVRKRVGDRGEEEPRAGDTLSWTGEYWRPGAGSWDISLNNYADVEYVSFPLEGQTLIWNSTTDKWNNGFYPESLGDLQDVDLQSTLPLDGDVLLYDESRDSWVPGAVAGGNANVELLDADNLPVGELRTLGVSEPEGDFYWVKEDNTDNWGKAIETGEVTFDDFSDVDMSGISEGQTLRWTYDDGKFTFKPADFLSPGVSFDNWDDGEDDNTITGLKVTTWGLDGGRYYTSTTWVSSDDYNSRNRSGQGLGMYGASASEGGIHVTREFDDPDITTWQNGVLKFPLDLQPDPIAGVTGIRPLSTDQSIKIDSKGSRYVTFTGWINVLDVDQSAVLMNFGTFKVELDDQYIVYSTSINGNQYEVKFNFPSLLQVGLWYYIEVGRNDNDDIVCFINGIQCNDDNGNNTIPAESGPADMPDWETEIRPLPVFMEGFKGYASQFGVDFRRPISLVADKNIRFRRQWPIGTSMGQLVTIGNESRLTTKGYDAARFGTPESYTLFTPFGNSTNLLDLQDVDAEQIQSTNNGYLYWDSRTQSFTSRSGFDFGDFPETEWEVRRASDFTPYTKSNAFLPTGAHIIWDASVDKFRPANDNLSFVINDAEDVDATDLQEGYSLFWDETAQQWIAGPGAGQSIGELGDLTNVDLNEFTLDDGHTILWSDAEQNWVNAPVPENGSRTLLGMEDVEATNIQRGETLVYDYEKQAFVNQPSGVPYVLDDLLDVDTSTTTPREGQMLAYNGETWYPGRYFKGGASGMSELYDVDTTNVTPGQALIWDGSYWKNTDVMSGVGDGGDFDSNETLASFTSGVWGGGDFDAETGDKPMELMDSKSFVGGGDFF